MIGLLDRVCAMPAETPLFAASDRLITAGRIRQTAAQAEARLTGQDRVYLHTASASLFVAGLLAAARKGLTVSCPAHMQPQYLQEIGATAGVLLTDMVVDIGSAIPLTLASGEDPACAPVRDPGLIFFTSGVTGTPKQVRAEIAQLDREAWVLDKLWGKQAGRTYASVSHQHIYGLLFRVFWPLLSGRVSEDRPAAYWESLSGKLLPGTTLVSSPAHLTRPPAASVVMGCAPGLIFSSGAPLPFTAAQAARELLGSLPIEVLGSTETGGIAWRQQNSIDALWMPFPDVRIETDSDGLLIVASPALGRGEPIATGDIVERVGVRFRLKGRADRVAKIDGHRISLTRVEEALVAHPLIEAAAAVDLPLRKGALGAIVELNAEGKVTLESLGAFRLTRKLRNELAGRLEPGERPKHWLFAPIPLDRQGKRVQALLRASFPQPENSALGRGSVVVLDVDRAEIVIEFPPSIVWFEGHFPNEPVLPGIAQVHLAAQWSERLWDWKPASANLSQVKFRRIIRPGSTVRLKLTRDPAAQRLKFAFVLDDIVASEGTIGGGE